MITWTNIYLWTNVQIKKKKTLKQSKPYPYEMKHRELQSVYHELDNSSSQKAFQSDEEP